MKCKCFDSVLAEVKKNLTEIQLKDIAVVPDSLSVGWEGEVWHSNDSNKSPVVLTISVEYRELRVNGAPYKSLTRKPFKVCMSYCPFCGSKYD